MELRAQLTGRDGQKRPLRVRCQPETGAGGELRGLLRGLSQLQEQVSALLAPLVEQESGGLAGAGTAAGPRGEWRAGACGAERLEPGAGWSGTGVANFLATSGYGNCTVGHEWS
uniref:EKC/KEOPS complex subunit GON7 n=2 Tax=Terrapene triunguis TaxID=2587831 RepID=A0A674K1R6_9SAUR